MKVPRVIISGGGTGGHVFPAIAIADALKKQYPDITIQFIGAKGRMEMEKVPEAGYEIEGLWISGFQRRLTWSNLMFPFKLLFSMIKARRLIKKFKPDVVIGVGGYSSGPVVRSAASMGIPTLIQEQNSYAGVTNRILARSVDRICVAFEGMDKYFPAEKIALTGNPVRSDVIRLEGKRERGIEAFGLDPDRTTVLAVGGSLGAKSINESIIHGLDEILEANVQLIWQSGKRYYEEAKNTLDPSKEERVKLLPFIKRMDLAYAVADVVISRAGAIAVSELALIGKPTIFIPSPNVAEDHQTKNAQALVDRKAAVLIKDDKAKSELPREIRALVEDPEKRENLSRNISGIALKDSADAIASEAIRLIK